jgi:hypothetical protein
LRRESYEHFYLTKVALGEGCGCAEHVSRMRDLDASADDPVRRLQPRPVSFATIALLTRFFRLLSKRWASRA